MKHKYNIKLIIIISIMCVLIITGLILFFKTDFFRTKRSAFLRYFQETPKAVSILETDVFKEYNDAKKNTPYIRKAEIKIQSSANVADSTILDKLRFYINQKTDYQNEKSSSEIIITDEGSELEKISLVKNKDIYGFFCSDVASGYISVKNEGLKRMAANTEISDATYIPDKINELNFEKIIEITKVEKNHISECMNIIKNNVPTNAYGKEGQKKIKVNDNSYTTGAYTLSLDENSNANLQIDLLNKISQDSILMDYITSKFKLLNFNEEYTTINSLNELMKKRIENLKKNPNDAQKLTITVYEYRQKNLRTEIINGNNTIVIDHLQEGNTEISSIKINDISVTLKYDGNKYILTYKDESENGRMIKIEYNQTGTIEDNDIKNYMTINYTSGIKSITYDYKDQVNFTNNIGAIDDFENSRVAVLNEYSDDQIKQFVKNLKNKINDVYVKQGANIGINLDPIFAH